MKKIRLTILLMLATSLASAEFSHRYIESHQPQSLSANGIEMAYRIVGEGQGRPKVAVIMGLGGSNVVWGDTLIRGLVEAGYQILMFDNRDTGGSTRFDSWGTPTVWLQLLKHRLGFSVNAPYTLNDMAADTVALMAAVEFEDAHIIGTSMGGMIAQIVAAQYPESTRSLISIMSTTGARHLPPPTNFAESRLRNLATGDAAVDREQMMRDRGFFPESMTRHLVAIFRVGDRSVEVANIKAPTLVMHGQDDALIPSAHGEHTAELIPDSEFVLLENMAHNLPAEVLPELIARMAAHIDRYEASRLTGS